MKFTAQQNVAANAFAAWLQNRLMEKAVCIHLLQRDTETGSVLCQVEMDSCLATGWVRLNGSIRAIDGARLLLAKGRLPKNNVSLSRFLSQK